MTLPSPKPMTVAERMDEFRCGAIMDGLDTAIEAALKAHADGWTGFGKLPADMDACMGTVAYDLLQTLRSELLDRALNYAKAIAAQDAGARAMADPSRQPRRAAA